MSDQSSLKRVKAYQIRDGRAVVLERDGTSVVCMKVVRKGKDYLHHYLLPLSGDSHGDLTLIYADPETDVLDSGFDVVFKVADKPVGKDETSRIDVGDVLVNPDGPFLKIRDHPKTERPFAYLHLPSGTIKYRQERRIDRIFREWQAELDGEEGPAPMETLLAVQPD